MKDRSCAWSILTLALLMLACTSETMPSGPYGKEFVFHATYADADITRTAIQSDGTSVWWSPDESINVFYGNRMGGKFTSTNTEVRATAAFRGVWTDFSATIEADNAAPVQSYWAVYPYDEANTCDGESVTLTIPSSQQGKDGTFADGMFPAIAHSSNLDLAFYYVCGGVRFSVVHAGITSVTFKANGGEPLAGTVRVGFDDDGKPEVREVVDGISAIEVRAPEGGFEPGKYYFATMLPQALSHGLSLTFRKGVLSASYVNDSPVTVNRTRFGKLAKVDKDLELHTPDESIVFEDEKVKEICLKWDTDGDGNLSYAEAAAVRDLGSGFQTQTIDSFDELRFFHGLTSIADRAFSGCSSLTSLMLPAGVTSIGESAFSDCSSLTSLTLPDGVTSIRDYAFVDCTSLASLTMPSSVTGIGEGAFSGCSSLTSLTISSGVTSIGEGAFWACSSLTGLTIPSGVTSLRDYVFAECSSLTSLTIPSGVTNIGKYAFYCCGSLTGLEIPSGVTNIGLAAFYGCENLTSMIIPSGVTSIGNYAFYRCDSLLEVRSLNPVPPSLSLDSYTNLRTFTTSCDIFVPGESVQRYQSQWSQYSGQIKALDI